MESNKLPAVVLVNPRYARNVAEAIRACSCFGIPRLWVTGSRVPDGLSASGKKRLPREERMKLYSDVEVAYGDYPFDYYHPKHIHDYDGTVEGCGGCFPDPRIVAVEIGPSATSLTEWGRGGHPENAVYVFGPEDGSLAPVHKRHCTDFVYIPTKCDADGKPVCLNLYSAVSVILGDRLLTRERKP